MPPGLVQEGAEEPPGSTTLSEGLRGRFPKLARLLSLARVTRARTPRGRYLLLGWTDPQGLSCGWLCPAPDRPLTGYLHPDHVALLREFGGIVARWREPEDTWLLNLNWALTAADSGEGPDGWYEYYVEACEETGTMPAIQASDYVAFALEANGNATFYHRESGEALLFAPDHSFDHVVPLEGAPEYTLYRIEGCRTFQAWIEMVARQWLEYIGP